MLRTLSFFMIVAISAVSCRKSPHVDDPSIRSNRTVIHYMVADNNLYECAEWDINEIESSWSSDFDGRMVVFLYPVPKNSRYIPYGSMDDYNENPRLLLISHDDDENKISSRILKEYTRELDPCNPTSLRAVIDDAMSISLSDSYALTFWSHGSGWLPKGVGQPLKSITPDFDMTLLAGSKIDPAYAHKGDVSGYTIGVSNTFNSELEIDQLPAALSPYVFDFMLFDACHMASVEVLYELRNTTKYIISSVAETWNTGFPYDKVIAQMMAKTADVTGIAREFFDYYNAKKDGTIYRTATISTVDCSALPALASAVSDLCKSGTGVITTQAIQQFGRREMYFNNTFYDLGDFVRATWSGSDLTAFESALSRAVKYQAATPWIFDGVDEYGYRYNGVKVNTHCGITCFIPRAQTPLALEAYRSRFGWSTASGMGKLIP